MLEVLNVSRPIIRTLIVVLVLGTTAFAIEPAFATPMAGATAIEAAKPANLAGTEQVYYRRGYRGRYGYGYRRPYGYHRYGYGYRRGIPGHPIRRILRAL